MQSYEVRQKFLDYFVQRGHVLVPSSSLIPTNDPSLLFTNAGMVPFKDVFLGQEQRPYQRACSSQKCLRVSGKHNDLEQVGPSPRHHTFFEMLGNFSFGNYFKRDAICYAWELVTREYGLPVERLWITVHEEDDEAVRHWEEVGVEPQRILRFAENFWIMGDTGPCGPNSEIHYYQGIDIDAQRPENVNTDDDDYVEIWNLVFMQYNRDKQGHLNPLPQPSVDTGMGLERIVSALQGVRSNYDNDLFQPIIQKIMELLGTDNEHYRAHDAVYNAIADHSRAVAFMIADGIHPGNGGRDYVLRRIIRRAAYLGQTLGFTQPFLAQVTDVTIDILGTYYAEMSQQSQSIHDLTTAEEVRFSRTLMKGLHQVESIIRQMSVQDNTTMPGSEAFKLHDTYGFPLDLTAKIVADRGFNVDIIGYETARQEQQERSRATAQFKHNNV